MANDNQAGEKPQTSKGRETSNEFVACGDLMRDIAMAIVSTKRPPLMSQLLASYEELTLDVFSLYQEFVTKLLARAKISREEKLFVSDYTNQQVKLAEMARKAGES